MFHMNNFNSMHKMLFSLLPCTISQYKKAWLAFRQSGLLLLSAYLFMDLNNRLHNIRLVIHRELHIYPMAIQAVADGKIIWRESWRMNFRFPRRIRLWSSLWRIRRILLRLLLRSMSNKKVNRYMFFWFKCFLRQSVDKSRVNTVWIHNTKRPLHLGFLNAAVFLCCEFTVQR